MKFCQMSFFASIWSCIFFFFQLYTDPCLGRRGWREGKMRADKEIMSPAEVARRNVSMFPPPKNSDILGRSWTYVWDEAQPRAYLAHGRDFIYSCLMNDWMTKWKACHWSDSMTLRATAWFGEADCLGWNCDFIIIEAKL